MTILGRFACGGPALLLMAACSESPEAPSSARQEPDLPSLAADAYVWGFPLVVTQRTLQTFGGLLGQNKLLSQAQLSDASSRLVVAPNQDTLYSVAVVDLRAEPMVLTVPDVHDRCWT